MPALECFLDEPDTVPSIGITDIEIIRGDDTQFAITFRDSITRALVDFTGWTFSAKAKAAVDGATWATATVTHNNAGGRVLVTFPKAQTAVLTPNAVGVWDLQGTDASALVHTIRRGAATVIGDVT